MLAGMSFSPICCKNKRPNINRISIRNGPLDRRVLEMSTYLAEEVGVFTEAFFRKDFQHCRNDS